LCTSGRVERPPTWVGSTSLSGRNTVSVLSFLLLVSPLVSPNNLRAVPLVVKIHVMTSSGYDRFEGLGCFYPEAGGSMFLPANRLLERKEVANLLFSVGAQGMPHWCRECRKTQWPICFSILTKEGTVRGGGGGSRD
jgi:hypothetical protein